MKFLLSLVALAVTCTGLAQGTSEAILDYAGNLTASMSKTVGWTFQPTGPLTVTELGCFAKVFSDNPAITDIQVGLWQHDGSLLASNSITSGSPLFDQTRYDTITPVTLAAGQTYHLGVYYSGGRIGYDLAGALANGSLSASPQVQVGGTAVAALGFAFPPEVAGTAGSIYAGPNFLFQTQPTLGIELWPTNQVRLSWPAAYSSYTPQSKPGLFGTWTNAGLSVTVVSNSFVAFDTIGPAPTYYRLIK